MSTWALLADLEVRIDGYAIEHHSREVKPGWERITTTYVLHGEGAEGRGEDITKWPPVAQAVIDRGPHLPLAGTFTRGELSNHLSTLDLFPDEYRAHAERGECLAGSCQTDAKLHPLAGPLLGLDPESVR